MVIMTQQLTGAVEQAGYKWKPTSLEYLHTAETAENEPELEIVQGGQRYEYKLTSEMWVLGTLLNVKVDTPTSISARMGVARRQFYKHHKLWRSKGNEGVKYSNGRN